MEGESQRIICHIDLDAFYCITYNSTLIAGQVEHVRLGISIDKPLAVQQWNGLIAINYACRACGISRHCTVEEARKKCPDINLVHVATYMQGDSEPKYNTNPLFSTHKVSLDIYRSASAKILQIMKRFCRKIERASIDEVYFDLTLELDEDNASWKGVTFDPTELGDVLHDVSSSFPSTALDYKLFKAAQLVRRVRDTVFKELGYTCSAGQITFHLLNPGISVNKTLAKLCSSMHKPNRQTILRLEDAASFVSALPITRIRLLGGKLGARVTTELECELAGDVCKKETEDVIKAFGVETGTWLMNVCRGVCHEEVVEREKVGSMGSCKSFRPFVTKWDEIHDWVLIIGSELFHRVTEDLALNKRWPKTMNIVYRSGADEKSKTYPFLNRMNFEEVGDLTKRIMKLLEGLKDDMIPCSRLAVHVSQFEKCEEGKSNLLSYFRRVEKSDTSFWCRDCHKEISLGLKLEHEDFHFATRLEEKEPAQTEEERLDYVFAKSLQDGEPVKKRFKITDYFNRL